MDDKSTRKEQTTKDTDFIKSSPDGLSDLLADGCPVEILECDKSGNVQQRWLHTKDRYVVPIQISPAGTKNDFIIQLIRGWRKTLFDCFLPVGFPHSVSDDYLAYQACDSIQAFFSTITSLLANRALLQGLGVGDANSSATYALLLTILTDAMSRIATIVFANRWGLRIEPEAKRYRFLADVFNDTAFFLELYSPALGPWGKVLTLSVGEALRALCGVAAGASKAALSVHFARHDNLAELNAKEASQETAVGLVGLLVGTLVVKLVQDSRSVMFLMIVLVMAHLFVNYVGVCSVHMTNLNRQRAVIFFSEYLKSGTVLSPKAVAKRESILFESTRIVNKRGERVAKIDIAKDFRDAMDKRNCGAVSVLDGHKYSLFIGNQHNGLASIKIMLWDGSDPWYAVNAWFSAMKIAQVMEEGKGFTKEVEQLVKKSSSEDGDGGLTDLLDSEFKEKMQSVGWDLDSQAFETKAPVRLRFQQAHRKDE
ncbi:unnamed protein product [Clonostachys rhizophaga]|uniref:Protein root UVB sensitive/RUS domain-containing protein n=1 Tax=Clonostachys rhizophaga TaxID=160324 RepID=A0A9N9V1V0_9HYPO|nr:unnamed protein product [Clonostachys rhizophaga]